MIVKQRGPEQHLYFLEIFSADKIMNGIMK